MIITPPLEITAARFTSGTPAEPWNPSAYNGATTYGLGDIALVAADFSIYESLAAANTGNTPNVSPTWWIKRGPSEIVYASGTTYALGDVAYSGHRIYQSLQASNTGHEPYISPTWWQDIGATNKYRALDLKSSTKTTGDSPLTYVITPGKRNDTIAVLGAEGDTVAISATSVLGGGSVYSYTEDLTTRFAFTFWDYCFSPFTYREDVVRFDIPPYSDIIVTVTVTRASGKPKVGSIIVGTGIYIGEAQVNAESDRNGYSTIERSTVDGSATLTVQRPAIPKQTVTVIAEKALTNKIRHLREDIDAIPVLYSTLDDSTDGYAELMQMVGIYTNFLINAPGAEDTVISLTVEGI